MDTFLDLREMELGANYLLERGILITYVGWHREDRRFLQRLDLNQIAQIAPEVVELIEAGENDDELVALLKQHFGVTKKRAKKLSRIYVKLAKLNYL